MSPKWLALAAGLLDKAGDHFSNHGCNDWEFPPDWTIEERRELVRAMYKDNGDPENFDPGNLAVPDWWVMRFLAGQMTKEVQP